MVHPLDTIVEGSGGYLQLRILVEGSVRTGTGNCPEFGGNLHNDVKYDEPIAKGE
jgi:hypothetical protein